MKPKIIITRGIPGSGKSYYIQKFCQDNNFTKKDVEICSADDFFVDSTGYNFDAKKLGEAHTACFRNVLHVLDHALGIIEPKYHNIFDPDSYNENDYQSLKYIFIDNTSIRAYEIAPYVQVANAYGLDHEIITIWCNPFLAAQRCVHKVPTTKIFDMYIALHKEELPPFWNRTTIMHGA